METVLMLINTEDYGDDQALGDDDGGIGAMANYDGDGDRCNGDDQKAAEATDGGGVN